MRRDGLREWGAIMAKAGNGEITGRHAAQQMCHAIKPPIGKR
jgi:hypothetical protein